MKVVSLHWTETVEHSAAVIVPDDFQLTNYEESELEDAVLELTQDTYYACTDRGDFWVGRELSSAVDAEELFPDDATE
ncbi:Uncharacterised protein [Nocardia farcinica]|uniref:hypothetical protein n=1 Tax=Nocardia farcinica TaxID=37329 RepID=UPI000E068640|nr:hypothetical protein [Nocardia farcinica]SUE29583.1 Uncharacterised protein [Nocardia farcinica]